MPIKTVIFDFDGTIADTFKISLRLINEAAVKFNLPTVNQSEIDELKNFSATEILKKYPMSPIKLLKLLSYVKSKLKENINNIEVFDGMHSSIKSLHKLGLKIGIVTSNSEENVRLFFGSNKITDIDFIHSEKGIFGKDKVLKHVINKYKLNNSEVIYIGDEVRDIEAAHKAKVKCIAVTWGFNSEARLKQAKPDYLITLPTQLIETVKILDKIANTP